MQIEEKPNMPEQPFWPTFTAAPHRMMFFAGAIQLVLPILFWVFELIGRYSELWSPLNTLIPTTWAHAFVMLYGVFTFFIFGFLMTVYPRWMNGPLVKQEHYVNTFLWMALGILLFEVGIFFNLTLAATGLAIYLFGWAQGQWHLYQVYKVAAAQNKYYETALNFALTAGWTGAASFLAWIVSDQWLFLSFALKAGIWLFLLPVLFTVSHRMLPFFSSSVLSNYKVIQPRWSLQLMLVASALHLLLDISHLPQWLFIADIPMAMVALYHTIKWQFKRSFADRLLAVLHMAFLWLGLSMLLFSIQSLYLLVSGELILGKGPLHALTIGFFSALLVAMASRVTMGHSGRMLILDNRSWYLFIGIQLTAVLRIFADINLINSILGLSFNVIASLCWLTCIGVWVSRYAPMYITARVDGRPG